MRGASRAVIGWPLSLRGWVGGLSEIARLRVVILVPPWVVRVSGVAPTLPARMTRFCMFEVLLSAGGSSPRLNTVEDGQDGGSTNGRSPTGNLRDEE